MNTVLVVLPPNHEEFQIRKLPAWLEMDLIPYALIRISGSDITAVILKRERNMFLLAFIRAYLASLFGSHYDLTTIILGNQRGREPEIYYESLINNLSGIAFAQVGETIPAGSNVIGLTGYDDSNGELVYFILQGRHSLASIANLMSVMTGVKIIP